jgi:PAS domain S-box-containing protein
MPVRNRFRITAILSTTTAIVILITLALAFYNIHKAVIASDISGQIVRGAFERVALRNDFVRTDSERPQAQWFAKHEEVGRLIRSASEQLRIPEDKKALDELIKDHDAIKRIFSSIVENRKKRGLDAEPSRAQEVEERLISQLNMRVYEVSLNARKLQESAQGSLYATIKFAGACIFLVLSLVSGIVIFNAWAMGKAITERVNRLREGAEIIGGGDLDHRIDLKGRDEFSAISDAFNGMTGRLRASYNDLRREIGERKQAQEALRESEQRWAVTLGSIGDAVIATDTNGLITFINQVAEDLTGWSRSEAIGKAIKEVFRIVNEYTREPVEDPVGKVLKSGMIVGLANHTVLLRRHSGEVPIDDSGAPIRDREGRVFGVVLIFRDISERRQAEAALREKAAEYGAMFERSFVGKAQADPITGRFLQVNQAFADITGYSPAEMCQMSYLDITHPNDRERDLQSFDLVRSGKADRWQIEKRYIRKDDSVVWVNVSGNLLRDEEGRPARTIAVIQDITERKRGEEEREIAVEFYQLINRSASTGDLIRSATEFFRKKSSCEAVGIRLKREHDYPYYETQGFPPEFILLENRLCARDQEGRPILDSIGDPVLECMCGNVICGRFDPLKPFFSPKGSFWTNSTTQLLSTTTDADRQARTRNRCHGEGYESVALLGLRCGNDRLGLLQLNDKRSGLFTPENIALWERLADHLCVALAKTMAEEKLRQMNETLEQKVTERTALAETRATQLQALAMELVEAEERERQRVAGLLHEDLQQILAAARMQLTAACPSPQSDPILSRVSQLLEESINKSRRLSHELSPAVLHHSNLFSAIEWLALQMKDQFGLDVRLKSKSAFQLESAPLKVFMFRAVQELLFNVVKHAGVKNARVEFDSVDGSYAIAVSDQGKGFNPDIVGALQPTGGFGLLSLRERTRYIGGDIVIESTPGKGSKFILTVPIRTDKSSEEKIPVIPHPPSTSTAQSLASTDANSIRVLLVDDHHIMLQGLTQLLNGKANIQVVGEAVNGLEAIGQARRLNPDVVVMDVSMPVLDGIEATRRIKAEMSNVCVIGLSMHAEEQVAQAMRDAGAEAFVSKASVATDLIKTISELKNRPL